MHLNRAIAPAIAELTTELSIFPEIKVLPNGARLHISKNQVQPIVRVEFVFKAGKWYQPKAGIASLTAKMLKEGTLQYSAKQIADLAEYYGASLDVSHGFDRASVTLYCLSKFLPTLLPLVFDVIINPSFPEKEFELVKQRVIQTLSVDKQKNSYLATEAFTTALYGKNHPYATYISEEDIIIINIDEVKQFHKTSYNLASSEIFITGDTSEEAIQTIEDYMSSFTQENNAQQNIVASPSSETIIEEKTSNVMQASLRIGKESISPLHSNYPALYLLNHTLGGYFGSRLMRNIREDKGYTYGIYSSLSHKEKGSAFIVGTDIKGDKIAETLDEISKEIQALRIEQISEEELATVKKHLEGKFLSDHSTIFDKMDRYRSNILLDLPAEFYTQLLERIHTLSPIELQEAASRYLQEETLFQVVIGGSKA
ncbi:insulinase family protein [Rufibacter immobilis]|uniref:Insulinase family protein n=1 Tax=Rufibacter immobilis TaxID=1348778 RepID=A0A3M9N8H0_9BACT|nr:pitrilysin family protein [Rufibacter immobilis]RNI33288.1 insulinase family protein [Rufibacter immobilis]